MSEHKWRITFYTFVLLLLLYIIYYYMLFFHIHAVNLIHCNSFCQSISPVPVRRYVSLGGWWCCQMTLPDPTSSSSMTQTKVSFTLPTEPLLFSFSIIKNLNQINQHTIAIQMMCHFTGNVYKFQTGSRFSAIIWHKNLEEACRSSRPQVCSAHTLVCLYRGSGLVRWNNSFREEPN